MSFLLLTGPRRLEGRRTGKRLLRCRLAGYSCCRIHFEIRALRSEYGCAQGIALCPIAVRQRNAIVHQCILAEPEAVRVLDFALTYGSLREVFAGSPDNVNVFLARIGINILSH